ncbi:Autophagy-related protein 13 [Scheffersomyces stipitis CBS 6054]|uniref:Autophagy-related protein 13 n=1 Tax=Scheffersomyces stipitis (strain ATCC 58785 / CBS 6054 / NBRC 10063 / NRRL Y-11545) TaxID=322104 RepID=ATG13_PICST|nr:Autophagy-related protein 13 [Scheffersomyces stipitis CBS 6054]A3LQY1.2 RecName: Full=Autophagy-related protein 13 [Scheffersomyces stipitis CBS 6054]ABN65294.2 Autophagy-related protein 13 [Scheffersomyces stipitis CBS 6054]
MASQDISYQYKSQQEHYPNEKISDSYVQKQNSKLTQVIQQCFSKAVKIIIQSRTVPPAAASPLLNPALHDDSASGNKINRWFNLHIQNSQDLPKDDLKLWKSNHLQSMPPMIIETYLDLRQLTSSQTIVLNDDNGNPWAVAKSGGKKQEVVLERWLIEFDHTDASGSIVDELPLIYKQAIILFRSIYGFARLMPAFKLKKRLLINKSSTKLNKLTIGNKILDGKQPISSKGRIGLSKTIIPRQMLTTDSHMSQKHFQPIQTSLGTLKISIAYRNHCDFCIHDNEEVLSTHFISMDSTPLTESGHGHTKANNTSMSVSPCSSGHPALREGSPTKRGTPPTAIQPFKVGSISNSPPPASHTPNSGYGGSLERRISITSNRSTSNASLFAMLRNPRSSTSSTHTTSNIPIAPSSSSNSTNATNMNNMSYPRSISSSHGSNMQHDDSMFSNPDSTTNTPRFSSSFGSRASRRYSNTSVRQSTPVAASTLTGGSPLSGLYIDDDISEFVRSIDSKADLRFSNSYTAHNSGEPKNNMGSPSGGDALNKFQMMKSHHQQLGDSVNASLILQHNNAVSGSGSGFGVSNSRHSSTSRKSSHSIRSPSPSMSGLYDVVPGSYGRSERRSSSGAGVPGQLSLPSGGGLAAHSPSATEPTSAATITPRETNFNFSNASFLRSASKLSATPVTSTTTAHATIHSVTGMATSPSLYQRTKVGSSIHYENVFEDDDDDEMVMKKPVVTSSGRDEEQLQHKQMKVVSIEKDAGANNFDDDDLLFTMSDMNLTKSS